MLRKRLLWVILLIVVGLGWYSYQVLHQTRLDENLLLASTQGDPEPVRRLLEQGADPNTRGNAASESPWQSFLNFVYRRPSADALIYPLSQALASHPMDANHTAVVRLLLEHHANPNVRMLSGTSAIWSVCQNEPDDRLLTLLLDHGANPNSTDRTGCSLLMCTQLEGKLACTRALLDHGANPNLANSDGDVPVMWAACHGEADALALLLAHGADVNHKNRQGQTALTYALIGSIPPKSLSALLEAGADVNAPDAQACTPFLYALLMNPTAAEAMLAKGGDVRKAIPAFPTNQTLGLSVQMHMEFAFDTRNAAFVYPPGATPLMLAAADHVPALVKAILAKGVDTNAQDSKGQTALDYVQYSAEITALLQHAGGDR